MSKIVRKYLDGSQSVEVMPEPVDIHDVVIHRKTVVTLRSEVVSHLTHDEIRRELSRITPLQHIALTPESTTVEIRSTERRLSRFKA